MARPKKEIVPTRKCLHCGMELEYKNFYQLHNSSNIYSGNDNYIPVCKNCMKLLCKDRNVLREYLLEREKEVVTIMMSLFDEEQIMKSFIRSEMNIK